MAKKETATDELMQDTATAQEQPAPATMAQEPKEIILTAPTREELAAKIAEAAKEWGATSSSPVTHNYVTGEYTVTVYRN